MADPLSGLDRPADARPYDIVTHYALPQFPMQVLAARLCDDDPPRSGRHNAYQVTDPEGNLDWVCGWDLVKV